MRLCEVNLMRETMKKRRPLLKIGVIALALTSFCYLLDNDTFYDEISSIITEFSIIFSVIFLILWGFHALVKAVKRRLEPESLLSE